MNGMPLFVRATRPNGETILINLSRAVSMYRCDYDNQKRGTAVDFGADGVRFVADDLIEIVDTLAKFQSLHMLPKVPGSSS